MSKKASIYIDDVYRGMLQHLAQLGDRGTVDELRYLIKGEYRRLGLPLPDNLPDMPTPTTDDAPPPEDAQS